MLLVYLKISQDYVIIKVSYNSTKFGGHRHSGRGDIMVFLCQVTFQDRVIKAISDHLKKIGGHRNCRSGDIIVLVCHVISQNHVIKGHMILCVGAPYGKSPPCQVWWP